MMISRGSLWKLTPYSDSSKPDGCRFCTGGVAVGRGVAAGPDLTCAGAWESAAMELKAKINATEIIFFIRTFEYFKY